VGSLLASMQLSTAQESATFEKIRDISPDGKFAVRISCSSEPEDPDKYIDPNLITAVELISLPSKKIVITLFTNAELTFGYERSVWSQDSNWFAVSFSSVRFSDTSVYHRSGEKFADFKTDELRVDTKGDVRNEYVRPVRWLKPGSLLLEQYDIFRGGEGEDATYRFTAKFDEKTGKFQITSKKKVQSKE
jgi:hypothetical protein